VSTKDEPTDEDSTEDSSPRASRPVPLTASAPITLPSVLVRLDRQWRCSRADGFGEAHDFLDRLAFHAQSDEQRGNLRVSAFSRQHFGHHFASLGTIERLALVRDAMESVKDHVCSITVIQS
jgi:hypothetical protein